MELVAMKIIKPCCMHEDYGYRFVCLSGLCVSANELAAIYLVYNYIMMKDRFCYHIDFNVCIECISLKTLCLKVLASFADHFYRSGDSSYNLSKSSLVTVDLQ